LRRGCWSSERQGRLLVATNKARRHIVGTGVASAIPRSIRSLQCPIKEQTTKNVLESTVTKGKYVPHTIGQA
jgi:hypothetical protein